MIVNYPLRDVLSSYYKMKTKTIVSLSVIAVVIIWLFILVPIITRGVKVKKLENLKLDYARCELVLKDTHIEADEIRKDLGLIVESWITPTSWTATQNIISLTWN